LNFPQNYYGHGRIDAIGAVAQALTEPSAPAAVPMYVDKMDMQLTTASRNTYATATVTIVDANGIVQGAQVTGQWKINGANADSDTGYTDTTGKVIIQSNSLRSAQTGTTFTFTITGVYKSGWIFTPGNNSNTVTKK
jgi:hypothetical protein